MYDDHLLLIGQILRPQREDTQGQGGAFQDTGMTDGPMGGATAEAASLKRPPWSPPPSSLRGAPPLASPLVLSLLVATVA